MELLLFFSQLVKFELTFDNKASNISNDLTNNQSRILTSFSFSEDICLIFCAIKLSMIVTFRTSAKIHQTNWHKVQLN
jgi:hypothetical protein